MLFVECEDIGTDEDTGTDEDMNWHGKCYKQLKLAWKEKLERDKQEMERDKQELKSDKQELKSDKQELEDNLKLEKRRVWGVILTHIKSLKGNFSEYIENASDHVVDQIQKWCHAFFDGCCPYKRKGTESLEKLVRKEMEEILDPDVSRNKKTQILFNQQKGGGIFS